MLDTNLLDVAYVRALNLELVLVCALEVVVPALQLGVTDVAVLAVQLDEYARLGARAGHVARKHRHEVIDNFGVVPEVSLSVAIYVRVQLNLQLIRRIVLADPAVVWENCFLRQPLGLRGRALHRDRLEVPRWQEILVVVTNLDRLKLAEVLVLQEEGISHTALEVVLTRVQHTLARGPVGAVDDDGHIGICACSSLVARHNLYLIPVPHDSSRAG
mmetsp:Transcript_23864/g.81368  ORF Transcript_23864/g.81368 Transcript_23864/m.81368 type:complete len:216 (-) Transcript_23864:628-1275(-)